MARKAFADRSIQIIMFAVYQYLVVKALTTVLTIITQAAGVYCETSVSPAFVHIWVSIT
jgi:hypothetical protein